MTYLLSKEQSPEQLRRWAKAQEKARVAEVLREHWLTNIECNHESKTDVSACFCSFWRSSPQPTVAQAVERWIEHVLEQL